MRLRNCIKTGMVNVKLLCLKADVHVVWVRV